MGNVIGAMFHHDTSRALDPHLHTHCVIFNATRDRVEERWKAFETYEMLAACKYAENVYYHELARDLRRFRYELENNRRGDFELTGVSPDLIQRFSKRHNEIDQKTQEFLDGAPAKRSGNVKDIRANLVRKNRARKIKAIGRNRLAALWNGQVSTEERAGLANLSQAIPRKSPKVQIAAIAAITWAEQHLFDRRSVVNEFELWRHALEHGRGQNFSFKHVQELTKQTPYIRNETHPGKVTTRLTLEREKEIVARAKDGAGHYAPLNAKHTIQNASLDPEQRQAVYHILASQNFVTLFRGAAGTGKSFTLKEVRIRLLRAGHSVHVLAPQRQQVLDLQGDLGGEGQTVSEFLTRKEMEQRAVVMVDEAGRIGAKQMLQLLQFVRENNGRF